MNAQACSVARLSRHPADTGTLVSDGSVFDSSVKKGRPFVCRIGLGMVIKGWDEGVMKMSLGERAMILIPAALS